MDVEPSKKKLKAQKMTEDEFKVKMNDFFFRNCNSEYEREHNKNKQIKPDTFIGCCCNNYGKNKELDVVKDLEKVKHDCENIYAKVNKILFTKQGVPYLQGEFGGDWEIPVFFIVYYDGSTFRGYLPEKGNLYNRNEMRALDGISSEADNAWLSQYDVNSVDDVELNLNACIQEFEDRIEVVKKDKVDEALKLNESYMLMKRMLK